MLVRARGSRGPGSYTRGVSDGRRIGIAAGCCVVAAAAPLLAGLSTAVVGLVPLACAVGLVARSGWALSTRVLLSTVVIVVTGALAVGLLLIAALGSGE